VSDRGQKTDTVSLKKNPTAAHAGSKRHHAAHRRLNVKAALVLAGLVIALVAGSFALKYYQDHNQQSGLLAQAKQFVAQNQPGPALIYLNRYLELNPDDLDARDFQSKIHFDLVHSGDQAQAAIPFHEQVVRNDTNYKYLDARRRLIRLSLAIGKVQTAYQYVVGLLDHSSTAQDYRLAGFTLVRWGENGGNTVPDPKRRGELDTWDEAIRYYSKALELEPGNAEAAQSLAYIYQNKRNLPDKAEDVLQKLLAHSATPAEKAAAHRARYIFYSTRGGQGDDVKALSELNKALELKPDDVEIRLTAALDALRRGAPEEARDHIKAVPAQKRPEDWRRLLGEIDLSENKVDAAIQDWREGLKASGGTSDELTWRLAFVLLRLDRVEQAKPLVKQYHRLSDRSEPTPKGKFLDALVLLGEKEPRGAIKLLEPIRLKMEEPSNVRTRDITSAGLAAEVAVTLGMCYEATDQDQDALVAYHQAAKAVQTSALKWPDPWLKAAAVLVRLNRLEDALNELQSGMAALPDNEKLLAQEGRVLVAQQTRLPKEQRNWEPVKRIFNNPKADSVDLIKIRVAYLVSEGQLNEAAAMLAKATASKATKGSADIWALRAEVLRQLGQFDQAIKVLDEGTAAVGEQAPLWVIRAQIHSARGNDTAAYETLEEGAQTVPPEQRPGLWKALGDLHLRLNDISHARKAYAEWAKLVPQDPEPLILLLDLALASNDEPAAQTLLAQAKAHGGMTQSLATAMVLLKTPPAQDEKARAEQLSKASAAVEQLVSNYPTRPIGYMLGGQLAEREGRVDDAVRAYRAAREHNGGSQAIRALFSLLARQRRLDELKSLRNELRADEFNPELEQVVAGAAIAAGDKDMAQELLTNVKGNPQAADVKLARAKMLQAFGRPKEAEETLLSLIQMKPNDLAPRVSLLFLQVNQKQFDKAAETVEQIRTQVKVERPEFIWAGCYWTVGNLQKADEYYKVSLEKWPNDQEVRERAIAFFTATNRRDEAEAALRKVLEREPQHGWSRRELAQILSSHVDDPAAWKEALKLIRPTASKDDTDEDRLVRAIVFARSLEPERKHEAIGVLEKLISETSGTVAIMAHDMLARIYLDANNLDKAFEHARAATASGTGANELAFYVNLLVYAKKFEEADKELDRLETLEPSSLRVLELRTRILEGENKGGEAAALLEKTFSGIEKSLNGDMAGRKILDLLIGINQLDAAERVGRRMSENWPKTAWMLSYVLARRGKLDEALKACQKAVDAGALTDAPAAATNLVTTKQQSPVGPPQYRAAEAVVQTALKQLPDNTGLLFARASLLRLLGRSAEAAQIYTSLLKNNPQDHLVLNNLAWTLSEDLQKPNEGLPHIEAAINVVGRDASLLDTRGVIFTRLGKFDRAIADLEASVKQAPAPIGYFHLARAYQMAGKESEFKKARERAIQLGLNPGLPQVQPNERAEVEKMLKS
jgi:tetratricopeptide (TPR) repeat protein